MQNIRKQKYKRTKITKNFVIYMLLELYLLSLFTLTYSTSKRQILE